LQAFLATFGDVEQCVERLDGSRRDLLALVDGVGDEILFRQPTSEVWSVGLIAEHIARAEDSAARAIRWLRRRANGEELTPPPARPGTLRSDGRPLAPSLVEPRGGMSREEIVSMLDSSRRFMIEQAIESGPLLDASFTLFHPFFGELTGLGWVRVAAFHEPHHLKQARNVLDMVGGEIDRL
jgi:hypothetical protein